VVGFELGQGQGPVGDERVVVPGGEQRQPRAGGGPDPPDDEADLSGVALVAGEHGERGLGDVGAGDIGSEQPVRDRLPGVLGDLLDRGPDPLSCRAVLENRTPNLLAVASIDFE